MNETVEVGGNFGWVKIYNKRDIPFVVKTNQLLDIHPSTFELISDLIDKKEPQIINDFITTVDILKAAIVLNRKELIWKYETIVMDWMKNVNSTTSYHPSSDRCTGYVLSNILHLTTTSPLVHFIKRRMKTDYIDSPSFAVRSVRIDFSTFTLPAIQFLLTECCRFGVEKIRLSRDWVLVNRESPKWAEYFSHLIDFTCISPMDLLRFTDIEIPPQFLQLNKNVVFSGGPVTENGSRVVAGSKSDYWIHVLGLKNSKRKNGTETGIIATFDLISVSDDAYFAIPSILTKKRNQATDVQIGEKFSVKIQILPSDDLNMIIQCDHRQLQFESPTSRPGKGFHIVFCGEWRAINLKVL